MQCAKSLSTPALMAFPSMLPNTLAGTHCATSLRPYAPGHMPWSKKKSRGFKNLWPWCHQYPCFPLHRLAVRQGHVSCIQVAFDPPVLTMKSRSRLAGFFSRNSWNCFKFLRTVLLRAKPSASCVISCKLRFSLVAGLPRSCFSVSLSLHANGHSNCFTCTSLRMPMT